jgi:hypothetical protein
MAMTFAIIYGSKSEFADAMIFAWALVMWPCLMPSIGGGSAMAGIRKLQH